MSKDLLMGWTKVEELDNQCFDCKYITYSDPQDFKLDTLVSCGYGHSWFPQARKCKQYESETS